jgi:serine/threonine-protein kinase
VSGDGITDPDLERLVGSTVGGKYHIERRIGRGGMGAVFEATHAAIGKRVALKFLSRDAARDRDAVLRFQREAKAASAVESAHIVQIFDSGTTDDGLPYLVMELLTGEDLRARLRREGRLALPEVLQVTAQVLRALGRAHEAGIVHRDLKPENVFLCERDDDPLFVKIVDFGISKVPRSDTLDTLTRRGTILGTAFYMSPEQAQCFSDIDGRTDLWSLGAILYETLSGRPPHTGAAYEAILISICTKDADDIRMHAPDVPEGVARAIAKSLARDRLDRFQSAAELAAALAQAAEREGLSEAAAKLSTVTDRRASGQTRRLASRPDDDAPATAGTLARKSVNPRLRTRRTAVAAVVAALGAFALTALLIGRAGSPESEVAPAAALEPSTLAATSPGPPGQLVVPGDEVNDSPSRVADARLGPERDAGAKSTGPSNSRLAKQRPTTQGAGTRSKATATQAASSTRPASGVASELQLNTTGP